MPTLTNSKHELFAQALADGKSASEAYVAAGYKANRGNASTLKQDQNVSKRVAEVLDERAQAQVQATAKAVEAAALTKEWVIRSLVSNAREAAAAEDYGPSNRALELLGKEIGMFIDHKNVNVKNDTTVTHHVEPVSDTHRWLAETLGIRANGAATKPLPH